MSNQIFMKQYIITLLLLLTAGVGKTWAQYNYVLYNSQVGSSASYGYLYNNDGTLTSGPSFNGSSYIWYSAEGKGTPAVMKGNAIVNMSGGTVTENVFGGGDAAKVDGNTSVTIKGPSHVGNNVYGGGNAAEVTGTTKVQIGEKKSE